MNTYGAYVASHTMRTSPDAQQPLTMTLSWASLHQHPEMGNNEDELETSELYFLSQLPGHANGMASFPKYTLSKISVQNEIQDRHKC